MYGISTTVSLLLNPLYLEILEGNSRTEISEAGNRNE